MKKLAIIILTLCLACSGYAQNVKPLVRLKHTGGGVDAAVKYTIPPTGTTLGITPPKTLSSIGWGGGSEHFFSEFSPPSNGLVRYGYYKRGATNQTMTQSMVGIYDGTTGLKIVEANSNSPTVCPTNTNIFRWELDEPTMLNTSGVYWCAMVCNDSDWLRYYANGTTGGIWKNQYSWSSALYGYNITTMHADIAKYSYQSSAQLNIWFSYYDDAWGE